MGGKRTESTRGSKRGSEYARNKCKTSIVHVSGRESGATEGNVGRAEYTAIGGPIFSVRSTELRPKPLNNKTGHTVLYHVAIEHFT
jgi:hypothetical protein